jgi:hypothetical protein
VRKLSFQEVPNYDSLKSIIGNFNYNMKGL